MVCYDEAMHNFNISRSAVVFILLGLIVGYATQFVPPIHKSYFRPVIPDICVGPQDAILGRQCPPTVYNKVEKRGIPFAYKTVEIEQKPTLGAPIQTSEVTAFSVTTLVAYCVAWCTLFTAIVLFYKKFSNRISHPT
jgi:hypothetical protein